MPALASAPRRGVLAVGIAAGVLGFAWLAIGSGLDRASETRPEFARLVPGPFASEAIRSRARQALTAGEGTEALNLAKAAVADAPIDPSSTALLGAARLAIADVSGADRAFRLAARLGWRIPYTQSYLLSRALEGGDYRVAALRLDALARQNPALLRDRRLLDLFELNSAGRAAIAARLASNPPWARTYAMALEDLPPERIAQRTMVLSELARQGGAVGCRPIGPLVSRLIAGGAAADAARLWRGHCPAAARPLIYDGTFAAASTEQSESQFAWFFPGQSDISVVLEPAGARPAQELVIDSGATRTLPIVRQLTLVAPGRYRLSWSTTSEAGTPSDQIVPAFTCSPDSSDWLVPQLDTASRRWTASVTMDGACPARWLVFAAKGGARNLHLGDVRLEPEGQTREAITSR